MKERFSLIVAFDKNRIIGKAGSAQLLWHFKEDLKFFQKKTLGQVVIMGSSTFWSLPKVARPLRGRANLVLTHSNKASVLQEAANVHKSDNQTSLFVGNLDEILNHVKSLQIDNQKEVFVIGGASVYELFLDKGLIDTIYVTRIEKDFSLEAGNEAVYFPSFSRGFRKTDDYIITEEEVVLHFEKWILSQP